MKKLFFFLFLLLNISTFAQTYPVQIVAVMTPPHSSKIADYANPMGNRIHLQLITTDLSVQNRAITLHLEIKGNGISAVSSPLSTGIPNLRISGGEILSLTHSELAHYFQLRNLQGITTEQYANVLPDGVYSFCFRVKDATSGQWLSQNQCTMAYLMLNDPPLLNIPSDNEQVQVSDFQNILFSWTPRQINAVNVAYAFELREILDPNLDPKFAFEVSRKVHFEENLRTTTFVYDVSKPNLVPGRRYAWRIKAASTGGLAENSVFKNNGYSEIRSFVYAVNCSKPAFLLSQQQGKTSVKLLWQGNTSHQKYHIQYRKKGVENAQWFESFTRNTQTIIANLQSGAEYEFRVGATCEAERYGTTPSFAYADIQTFSIEKQEKSNENSYNCGIVPKIEITNQKPLASLIANEVFTAGDFPVQVLEAQGSNGIFSGKGFIKVPYLNDTKLSVSFENVKINTDNQLIEGVVKTTYDPSWGNVVEVDLKEIINSILNIGNTIKEVYKDGIISSSEISILKENKELLTSIKSTFEKTETTTEEDLKFANIIDENIENIDNNISKTENSNEGKTEISDKDIQTQQKLEEFVKIKIVDDGEFEKIIEGDIFIPSYAGVPIQIDKLESVILGVRGQINSFNKKEGTYIATITNFGNVFWGYFPEDKLEEITKKEKIFVLTQELKKSLQEIKFKNYKIAQKGDDVFTIAKRIEGQGAVLDCRCEHYWTEEKSYQTIETSINKNSNVVPKNSIAENCEGTACETQIVLGGLGSHIFVGLSKNLQGNESKLQELEQLKQFLDKKTQGKTYAIYDPDDLDKLIEGSNRAYIEYFKKNKIFNIEKFKDIFKFENFSKDVQIIFSSIDLRRDIPKNYNINSKDYHYKDGRKYEYSFVDLSVRYQYLYLINTDNPTISRVIKEREKNGEAQAISTHEGYKQYVGKYGTDSAIFFWMKNYFLEVADPVQLTQGTKIVSKFLNNGDNILKFSKQSIENKKTINELFENWEKNKNKLPDDFVKKQDEIWEKAGFGKGFIDDVARETIISFLKKDNWPDADIKSILHKSKELNIDTRTLEDFAKLKDIKGLSTSEILEQMDNWVNIVKKRGYPFKFNSLNDFNIFKDKVKGLLDKIGIKTYDIRVQGSSLRNSNAKDIDIAIFLNKNDLDDFIQNFRIKKFGNRNDDFVKKRMKEFEKRLANGKISSYDFYDLPNGKSFEKAKFEELGDVDISIIIEGSKLDVSPYLKF